MYKLLKGVIVYIVVIEFKNVMSNLNKISIQVLVEEIIEKGNLEEKFKIAKKLLDVLDSTIIAMKIGLSLSQV